jgi:hypothetical protein
MSYTARRGLSLSKPGFAFDKLRLHLYSHPDFNNILPHYGPTNTDNFLPILRINA